MEFRVLINQVVWVLLVVTGAVPKYNRAIRIFIEEFPQILRDGNRM